MLLNLPALKVLLRKLDDARRESTGPGEGAYCTTPNTDSQGNDFRWEPKPYTRRGGQTVSRVRLGEELPSGPSPDYKGAESVAVIEEMPDGRPGVKVPLGVHGRAYLAINVVDGRVYCQKCADKV